MDSLDANDLRNTEEIDKLNKNIEAAFEQQDKLFAKMQEIDAKIQKLDGQREAKEKEA